MIPQIYLFFYLVNSSKYVFCKVCVFFFLNPQIFLSGVSGYHFQIPPSELLMTLSMPPLMLCRWLVSVLTAGRHGDVANICLVVFERAGCPGPDWAGDEWSTPRSWCRGCRNCVWDEFYLLFFFFGDCAGPPAIYRTLRFVFPGVHVFISSTRSLGFKLTSTK